MAEPRDEVAQLLGDVLVGAPVPADADLLANIRTVQMAQHLPPSGELVRSRAAPVNLDVEMETGTGKTYCYIKTIFELNKRYGWSKFIVVVPSIAIQTEPSGAALMP